MRAPDPSNLALRRGIVPEKPPPLDPPANDAMQSTGCVYVGSSRHGPLAITGENPHKVIFSYPSPFFAPLSEVIDQTKIDANLNLGVLRLSLPKVAKAAPRKIAITAG
jgi:hypothetical protein